jgi:hypothetical protein
VTSTVVSEAPPTASSRSINSRRRADGGFCSRSATASGAAGGDERSQLLPGDSLAERGVVPGERLLQTSGLEVALEFGLDPRVESAGRETLGHDPIDRQTILVVLSSVGTQELRADAGRQAVELNAQSRALQEIVEYSGLGLMVRRRDDTTASIALHCGRRRDSARYEHRSDYHRDRRATSHLSFPLARRARSPEGNCISSA